MSGGAACREAGHRHVVVDRNCNYSAFNGYRRTWSRYSKVRCIDTRMVWRTDADYVRGLPDAEPHEDDVTMYR